jgi:hypothetical protein
LLVYRKHGCRFRLSPVWIVDKFHEEQKGGKIINKEQKESHEKDEELKKETTKKITSPKRKENKLKKDTTKVSL